MKPRLKPPATTVPPPPPLGKRVGLAYLAFTLIASAPLQAAEPLGFKGIHLGSAIQHIQNDPRFDCRLLTTPLAEQVCTLRPKEQETLAGAPVSALYYFYDRARLTQIVISVAETHFQTASDALKGKYGAPEIKTETLANLSGQRFENRQLTWRQGDLQLQAERYAGRLDRSVIRFTDTAAAARIQARRATSAGQDL